MMRKSLLFSLFVALLFSTSFVQAQYDKKFPQMLDPEQPNFNWKYRWWGDYVNPKHGVQWKLGRIARKISRFWKLTSIPSEGGVSVLRMTYHQWSLKLDAYPQNANVTGRGGAVIYQPGQPPKKTIEIYLPELQQSVADFKELGDVSKEPLFGANRIKGYVQRFSGRPVTDLGGGKKTTSQDTYIYEFWVTDKASKGYQFVISIRFPEIYVRGKTKKGSIKQFRKQSKMVLSTFGYCDQDDDWKEKLEAYNKKREMLIAREKAKNK